jgi:hypothetical protein
MDKDFTRYRKFHLHSANHKKVFYWNCHFLGEVDKKCGDLFGDVFDEFNHVYIFVRKGDGTTRDVVLTRDSHMLTVMRMLEMDLKDIDTHIDIYAKNVTPPGKQKVCIHMDGGYWKHEEEVDVDQMVGDLFEKVFNEFKYVYIKSEKALNKKGEHRLGVGDWLDRVIRDFGLANEDVVHIYAEKSE